MTRNQSISRLIEELRGKNETIVLDVGCGKLRRGNICIDRIAGENVDFVMDINQGIDLSDESVDKILIYHTLEHTNNPPFIIEECKRILKNGGLLEIKVPHHSNPRAYDIFHKNYWSLFSFDSFLSDGNKSNDSIQKFFLIQTKIIFFKFHFLEIFFSKHPWLYELYLFRIFPAYEIHFIFTKYTK